jgi:hypothetical protein
MMASRQSLGVLAAALIMTVFSAWFAVFAPPTPAIAHFADADDLGMVTLGKKIYMGTAPRATGEICRGSRCGS